VIVLRRLTQVIWPLLLLAVFAFVFRRGPGETSGRAATADCEKATLADAEAIERCLAVDPTDVSLQTALGAAYEASGQSERAESAYRRALSIDAADGRLHLDLGRALLARGDVAGARIEAQAAARRLPGSAEAQALLARAGGPR